MKKPLYILSATPQEKTFLKGLFIDGESSLMNLISNPGRLRYGGWDLITGDTARIVKGEYIEVRDDNDKVINLYEDGTLITTVSAGPSFLGHGSGEDDLKDPRLNPLALIEVTYNFVSLYQRILKHMDRPSRVNFNILFTDLFLEENNPNSGIYLTPYGIEAHSWITKSGAQKAPANEMTKEVSIQLEDIENIDRATFILVEKIYHWFGLSSDKIPYVSSANGILCIDKEKMLAR